MKNALDGLAALLLIVESFSLNSTPQINAEAESPGESSAACSGYSMGGNFSG